MNRQATIALVATLATVDARAGAGGADDPTLRADLQALARRSVFFGHQSVGANLVEGLRGLAADAGVPLRIVETQTAARVRAGTFAHGLVAENGAPALKLESFARALGPGPAEVDVALVKLCFVDVGAATDVRALFDRYRAALQDLRARHPRTTFVHVTVPLTVVQTGWKATVKTLLGRAPWGFLENARREELNGLLRAAYEGREPLFDIARLESTGPDGRAQAAEVNGRAVPALAPAYTDDGGHLGPEGRRRIARRLVAFLAALPAPGAPAPAAR